ncbi:UDP-diphosphate synthase [Sulfolobus acidocaldarius SUSAZ]|nr:UDP-diphosphate synthase [Sulfolobus acidocaldarius SUSAZ]
MAKDMITRALLRPIYKIYEKILWSQIKDGPFPFHVGIIPDGNRRWARNNRLPLDQGYYTGYVKLRDVLTWILEIGISTVTVFALSAENCEKRTQQELSMIFKYLKIGLDELLTSDLVHKYQVRVKAIGMLDKLPEDLKKLVVDLESTTEKYNKKKLILAICYGGRQEILDAIRKIMNDYKLGIIDSKSIDESTFRKYLYDQELSDIDLLIRSSGEIRISNFLLWHLAYSELFFVDVYWPDFRKIDLWRAIRSFQKRKRNFGA